jgi:hypothetical protein
MTVIAANVTYTNSQLACILADVQCKFGNYAATYSTAVLYDLEPCDSLNNAKLLLAYYWIISTWQQNSDGTTTGYTNFLSQEDFVTIVEATKKLSKCRCG